MQYWLPAICLLILGGCTWVDVDDEAAAVELVTLDRVGNCDRIGTTEATTKPAIGPMKRSKDKVEAELLTLARNSAAKMGGDTVVAQGPVSDGSRTFVVYFCDTAGRQARQTP